MTIVERYRTAAWGELDGILRSAPEYMVYSDGVRYNMNAGGKLWYMRNHIFELLNEGNCYLGAIYEVGYLWEVSEKELPAIKKAKRKFPEAETMVMLRRMEELRC